MGDQKGKCVVTRTLDWFVTNHGSIFTFAPLTEAASEWAEQHLPEDSQRWGDAYVVEHRFAHNIAEALLTEGFEVGP